MFCSGAKPLGDLSPARCGCSFLCALGGWMKAAVSLIVEVERMRGRRIRAWRYSMSCRLVSAKLAHTTSGGVPSLASLAYILGIECILLPPSMGRLRRG